MTSSLSRPLAAITGASSGIGAVYAEQLAARGHDLLLIARRGDRLDALASRLGQAHGVHVQTQVADLSQPADLRRVEEHLATAQALELLVNNAGSAKLAAAAQTTADEAEAMVALNVTALTRLTLAALPGMRARGRGRIVNISSVLALHALPTSAVYSGTKAYVLLFSRGLQQELAGSGVSLQVVLPSATDTEIWDRAGLPAHTLPAGTVMQAGDMVRAALAGLDQGEAVTLPSLHDAARWDTYEAAGGTVFEAARTDQPAPRYRSA